MNCKVKVTMADDSRVVGTLVSFQRKLKTLPAVHPYGATADEYETRLEVDSATLGLVSIDAKYIKEMSLDGKIMLSGELVEADNLVSELASWLRAIRDAESSGSK